MEPLVTLPSSRGPVPLNPRKILALGLNYHEHIQESASVRVRGFDPVAPEEPMVFPKAPSALVGDGEAIRLPAILDEYRYPDERTDYEGELALVISRTGYCIREEYALDYVLGYMCANDVSQRNIQNGDRAGWFRGKSFDTFLPVGPRLVYPEEVGDPHALRLQTRKNGVVVQDASTARMIVSIPRMISWISRNFTLYPGDILLTGTPAGVGPVTHNDEIAVEIEGIGVLSNRVIDPRRG